MKNSHQIFIHIFIALMFQLKDTRFVRGMDTTCVIQKKDLNFKVTCYFPTVIQKPFEINFKKEGTSLPRYVLLCDWNKGQYTCEPRQDRYRLDDKVVFNKRSVSLWMLNASTDDIGIYKCDTYSSQNKECFLTKELYFSSHTTMKPDSVSGDQDSTTTRLKEDLKTGAVKNIGPNTDTDYTLIIAVASCVCLVVITTVITAGLVCCVKARRRYEQTPLNPDMNMTFAHLNEALHVLSKDQARDIYEEIPDLPKIYRTSRVGSNASSKSGVRLPPIPTQHQNEAQATQRPTEPEVSNDFGGYLHPLCMSTAPLDNKEFTDKCVQSP